MLTENGLATPQEVLSFWFDEMSPADWYNSTDELDATIRNRFAPTWQAATRSRFTQWFSTPRDTLAYLILLDQFPRNMFRGLAESFASDRLALAAAKLAIGREWDLQIDEPARQFFYMPLMHSEILSDQDRCVRLMSERLKDASNKLHARTHREIIRLFGRFPYRNDALGRASTLAEQSFLNGDGYGGILRDLDGPSA